MLHLRHQNSNIIFFTVLKVLILLRLEHFCACLKIWLSQGSAGSIPVRGTEL